MIRLSSQATLFPLCLVLLVAHGCQSKTVEQNANAITNVTVIDSVGGVRENQTVIFEDDLIVAVVPHDSTITATNTIDGSGKFLIPGLWDMHVHLTYDPRLSEAMPEMFLRHGVTSVRDTGGLLHKLKPIIAAMRLPNAVAPRVFFSGPLMDGQDVVYDGNDVPEIGMGNASVEEAKENLLRLKEAGADFVKIYEMVSPDVFTALSETARANGMPVAAHVPLSMTASSAAPFVDSLEHLRNLELDCTTNAEQLLLERREALKNDAGLSGLALRSSLHASQRPVAIAALSFERCQQVLATLRDVIQVPTASLNTISIYPPWLRADWSDAVAILPDEVRDEWLAAPAWYEPNDDGPYRRMAEQTLNMISMMKAAGVPIGAGTDTPIARAVPGDSLHSELAALVAGGLTPLEAIESATVRPAEFFGLESTMGAIQAGMFADLVLLSADPLVDIQNTRAIDTVIYRGNVYGPAGE